jgi:hypothetical protein
MAKLPSVVSSIPQDLKAFINQVREAIDGRGGDKLVTFNDLIRGGLAAPGLGNVLVPPAGVVGTPSTPKNVQASGAIQNIVVTWDDPLYNGHAYAEVWGSSTDNLGEAVQVGMTPGAIFVDAVGPSVIRYYWVRFVNVLGVQGAFNAVAGVRGETGPDVDYLLEVLTGQITEAQLFSDLSDRIDNIELNTAAIQTEAITRQTADTSLASQITTVSAATSTNSAAIQTEITTRASETGNLFAKYTVKVDLNGYVSGFGLASTANNATPFSEFAIRADRFYVASPSGPGITPIIPFIVNTTSQTVNGVTVPPGVYMDAGFIKNGTITNAKIGNAAIDDAKIANLSAAKITAGSIGVGSFIESTGFITGSQGWRIHGNGFAEFAATAIRGQLTAAQIDTRNLTIKDASGTVIFSSGGVDYTNVIGTKPPSNATRNAVFSSPTEPTVGVQEGDFWNDTSNAQAKVWSYLSGSWRLTGTEGATFSAGAGQIAGQISSSNISTYIAGAAIGTAYISNAAITNALIANAAITSAKIQNAEVGTLKIAGNAVTVPSTLDILSSGTTITRKASPFSSWQQVGSLSVSFDIAPTMVAVFGTVNVLTAGGGPGVATLFARVRESVSGTTSPPIGVVTDSSSNIVVVTGLSGIGTGSRTFVLEVTRDNLGFDFSIGDANITVLGAKR